VTFLYNEPNRHVVLQFVRFLGPSAAYPGCTEWELESANLRGSVLETVRKCSLSKMYSTHGELMVLPMYLDDIAKSLSGKNDQAALKILMSALLV
jgi:hypothetical protein